MSEKGLLLDFINSSSFTNWGNTQVKPSITLASNSQVNNINIESSNDHLDQSHKLGLRMHLSLGFYFSHYDILQNSVWLGVL